MGNTLIAEEKPGIGITVPPSGGNGSKERNIQKKGWLVC